MQRYIRHPAGIPIEFQLVGVFPGKLSQLQKRASCGLVFESSVSLETGSEILLSIPIRYPLPRIKGIVAWCEDRGEKYEVGIDFFDIESAFEARMVEQLCHIEQYRREILRREGRELTRDAAANEWIHMHAGDFPLIN